MPNLKNILGTLVSTAAHLLDRRLQHETDPHAHKTGIELRTALTEHVFNLACEALGVGTLELADLKGMLGENWLDHFRGLSVEQTIDKLLRLRRDLEKRKEQEAAEATVATEVEGTDSSSTVEDPIEKLTLPGVPLVNLAPLTGAEALELLSQKVAETPEEPAGETDGIDNDTNVDHDASGE